MVKIGEEEKFSKGNLPVRSQVFAHYLYLRRQKVESGEWKSNVSVNDAARAVKVDVQAQWEKTGIPHSLDGQAGDRKVERLILKCRKMQKKQLKIEIKILDKNLTACLMSRPAKTRILNPAIVLQGSRCLQIGLHSSKIRGAAGCTPTLCFLIGLSRYVEVFDTLVLRKKMSIKGPLKSLRKKSKGRKGWLRGKENLIKMLTTCSELRGLGLLTTWVKSNLSLVVRMMRIGKTKWTGMRKMVEESITG